MAIPQAFLELLEKETHRGRAGGGEDKLEARRKKGIMTARDRLKGIVRRGNRTIGQPAFKAKSITSQIFLA